MADEASERASKLMGVIRDKLGNLLDLIEKDVFRFCWMWISRCTSSIQIAEKSSSATIPFPCRKAVSAALNEKDPLDIRAFQYDIVCNGYELSSGAIRNHDPETMYRAFEIAGYTRAEVDQRFRALISALKFGAPPHGGIAPGSIASLCS
jgi:aspartyl-tRNA synthetase